MMGKKEYRALAAAVCLQAIDDYDKLCRYYVRGLFECAPDGSIHWNRGNKSAENAQNRIGVATFREIETFFEWYGELYAGCDPAPILRMLRAKRARAQNKRAH